MKTFVGTSANALQVQIWTALIGMLIFKYFVYRDLYRWIDVPFEAPPALAGIHDGQLALFV